ncbi:MAG: hypothetical protein KDB10_07280 [Acidimicrobiales bacterium]|nr:hypothetical protein [Acidimicrobiales bacterium]MCB9372654.1 hypothetical protein [Microthrixaceae bacterium]
MSEQRPVVARVADVVVYAPLGLALEGRRLFPDLVDRGRRQVQFTRVVGKFAVRRGEERAQQAWSDAQGLVLGLLNVAGLRPEDDDPEAADPIPVDVDLEAVDAVDLHLVADPEPRADGGALAIPGYDSLSAFQVMPRLEGLGPDELEAVRDYERQTRGRQTILNKIAQLQAS